MNRAALFALAACIFSVSCATVTMNTPEGFAHFDKEKFYKSVSADALCLTGRVVEDEGSSQNSDLPTWEAEINRALSAKGYTAVSKNDLNPAGGDGRYCEYEVIFNGEMYSYAVLLAKKDGKLFTVEAGGRKARFAAKKDEIIEAMKSAHIK
jgi:hypothetical protein